MTDEEHFAGNRDPSARDPRLYAPYPEGTEAHIKHGWEKEYCFLQNPGEDHFHLLINGEIFIQRANEKYCLRCALRHGLLTTDRLNWQHGPKKRSQGQII